MRRLHETGVLIVLAIVFAFTPGPGPFGASGIAWAQRSNKQDPIGNAFDPDKFFQQFFSGATEEQKRTLEAVAIPWEEELRFGKEAADRFLAELRQKHIRVMSRGAEIRYLMRLVDEIRPHMAQADRYRSITILLAESSEPDARCFPGGTLVVFRGMLELAQSEAALVGVLGHELSHIDHGHQLRYLKSMKLAQRTFSGGRGAADLRRMMDNTLLISQSFARPFRPEEEAEADADGATWAYRLGYDPRELARVFLRMEERGGEPALEIPSFFRSHPHHRDRYEAVLRRFQQLQRSEPRAELYVGRRNLIELVPRSKRPFDE